MPRSLVFAALLVASLALCAAQVGPGQGAEDGPIEGAQKPTYREPDTPIPQVLADNCEAGLNIRLDDWKERNQDLRPWDAGPVALVVIDLQPLFNDVTSHWGGEAANATYWRLLPKVEALAGALTEYCGPDGKPSGKSIFTQFITADEPGQGNGSWGLYYQNRPKVTVSGMEAAGLDPAYMLAVNPEVQAVADAMGDNAWVVNKTAAGAFSSQQFRDALQASGAKTVIVMGVETDYCVLSTVLASVDAGIRTIVADDALGSSQPNSGQAVLDYTFRRFPDQIELAPTDEIVAALQAAACPA